LTLSLCGLGWLDETEIETIKDAKPVTVIQETGEIVDAESDDAPFTVEEACNFLNSKGKRYGDIDSETLRNMAKALANSKSPTPEDQNKITRIQIILADRAKQTLVDAAAELGGVQA
jgi:hypothetical protein